MSMVRQAIILSVALLFAVALVWQLALAAADELRRTSRRCTAISFVLFMLMCGVTVHVCATKPQTNDTDGVAAPTYGMLSFLMAPEIGGMTDEYDAFSSTNVYFSSFSKSGDVARTEITIGEHGVAYGETIRIYAADNLEHPAWTNVYEHDYENESSLTVQFDMSQFPTSFWTRALFGLDFPQDSDGDGVSNGSERFVHHSNPYKYDTDGDGLGDGDELRIGTCLTSSDTDGDGLSDSEELGGSSVMTDSSMLWLDTSSCAELSLGGGGFNKNWSVDIPGGVGLAGNDYSACRVYLYGRLSFADGAVCIDAVGQSMYAYPSWLSKVLCGLVVTNGAQYFVVEYRNISPDSSGTVKLTCQIIIPTSVRNVVYVSYQRVDDVIDDQYYPLGVTCSNMVSPFDPSQAYSILPPPGYRKPVANTTIKYIIGFGSDPTVYNRYEEPTLPPTSNTNAYYTIDVVADDHAHIVFTGDGASNLPDPDFWAVPGENNRVKLLMGKTYVANANTAIGCVGVSDTEAVVSNVSECAFSVVRPVRVTALEGNGLSFLMRVRPSNLGGAFVWTNSCCSITGNGNEFWYAHSGKCTCNGCYAAGAYQYEGYSLPCLGGYCDCPNHNDESLHPQVDDGPYAEGITVGFSAPAVIFEDAYNNNPTSTVPRRSTQTTLSCVVHGGYAGGFAEFSLANASRLTAVEGSLPERTFVPPMQKVAFDVCYEGEGPSTAADDIVATGTFTPRNGGTALTDSDTLTSVRVELKVINIAFENESLYRHEYGINEPFILEVSSCHSEMEVEISDAKMTSSLSAYNIIRWGVAETNHFLRLSLGEVVYEPMISVLTPSGIEGYDVVARGLSVPAGSCGGVELNQKYRILPKTVSFNGLLVEEVPCGDEIPPTGYFQYFPTNRLSATHNISAGAGRWHYVNEDNSTDGYDSAAFVGVLPRIKQNGEFTDDELFGWMGGERIWKIPFGWTSNSLGSVMSPVGVFASDTRQTFTIFANGDLSVSKLGHKAYRKITGEVYKDGAEAE